MKIIACLLLILGIAGLILFILGKLSQDGSWILTGIWTVFVITISIIHRKNNKKAGLVAMIITIAIILTSQTSKAQTFEELEVLSSTNTSILQLLTPGNFGPISLYEDEGSMGQWVKIEGSGFYFSSTKEIVTSLKGTEVNTPTILGGKINEGFYVLIIRIYKQDYIQGENQLYFIDAVNEVSQEVFIPGYISKIFLKDDLIFVDSQVAFSDQRFAQLFTTLSLRGEMIVSTTYQKGVDSNIIK